MNYVYILLLDDMPIYAGMTNNPVLRFKRHYMAKDCSTHPVLRYYMFEKNKLAKMKLVYCSPDRHNVGSMESLAIRELFRAGFSIINVQGCYPTNYTFPKFESKLRTPHGVFTDSSLQYIKDQIPQIHKEYGY